MFKRSSDQFNSLDVNHVTNHSSFSLVNRLQLTHTVTVTIHPSMCLLAENVHTMKITMLELEK